MKKTGTKRRCWYRKVTTRKTPIQHTRSSENKHKKAQKASQDRYSDIKTKALDPGTRVLIKCEGIRNKHDAKLSGQFIITRQTQNLNYKLKDVWKRAENEPPHYIS